MPACRLLLIGLILTGHSAQADPTPVLFDGHIHYSQEVWDTLPPQRALALMSEAGIDRAIVSATPGEGAERLYRAAPRRIVPFLRPYSDGAKRTTWFREPETLDYVHQQLERAPYRGIGEFHLSGDEARTLVVQQLVQLAQARGLALHAHTDLAGIRSLLRQAPDIPVIWAHGGFDVPEVTLRQLLGTHDQLVIELSFREGLTAAGQLTPVWSALLRDFPTRFLTGMDTYIPSRWVELPDIAAETRAWLQQLPPEVARNIAYANAERLFPQTQASRSCPAGQRIAETGQCWTSGR